MNLGLALDNSFEIMNEDEMFDVNGGWGFNFPIPGIVKYTHAFTVTANFIKWTIGLSIGALIVVIGAYVGGVAVGILGLVATSIIQYAMDNTINDKYFEFEHLFVGLKSQYKHYTVGW